MRNLRRLVRPAALASVVFLLAACATEAPQDALAPEGPIARQIDHLFKPVFWIAAGIFFLVEGLIVYATIKFRDRPDREEPKQIHGNTKMELAWTLAPALLLAAIAIPTVLTIFDVAPKATADTLRVTVTAKQWWWEYTYENVGEPKVITANELVIPTGRPVLLDLTSADVIHSFWIPKLNGKQDVVPDRTNQLELIADTPDTYEGQCAEFCGISHANMRIRVIAKTPSDFDAWVAAQQMPAASPTSADARQGEQIFLNSCAVCHQVQGLEGAAGRVGPDLTHFMSRERFAGAILENTPQNIHDWIRNTRALKPGVVMPVFEGVLTDDQISLLTAYIMTLR